MKTARFMFQGDELGVYDQYEGQPNDEFEAGVESTKFMLTRGLLEVGVEKPYVMVTIESDGKKVRRTIRVTVTDNGNYDPDFCKDGGKYAFYDYYTILARGAWEVTHGTSSDFPYCPYCGTFFNPENGECGCGMKKPAIVDTEFMNTLLESVSRHMVENRGDLEINVKEVEVPMGEGVLV